MEPGYYSYVMSNVTKDILKKMALEDHVSFATELEMAVSCWYRFRHGFEGLAKTREIEELQKELAECSCRTQNAIPQSQIDSMYKNTDIHSTIDRGIRNMNRSIDDGIRAQMEGVKDAENIGG